MPLPNLGDLKEVVDKMTPLQEEAATTQDAKRFNDLADEIEALRNPFLEIILTVTTPRLREVMTANEIEEESKLHAEALQLAIGVAERNRNVKLNLAKLRAQQNGGRNTRRHR